jgi:hypothetical protein
LIFNPFDDSIFEIKYVQFDQPFFTLGKGYIFELQCEKFEYSGEDFDTLASTRWTTFRIVVLTSSWNSISWTGGTGTFKLNEKVTIYNIANLPPIPDSVVQLSPLSSIMMLVSWKR